MTRHVDKYVDKRCACCVNRDFLYTRNLIFICFFTCVPPARERRFSWYLEVPEKVSAPLATPPGLASQAQDRIRGPRKGWLRPAGSRRPGIGSVLPDRLRLRAGMERGPARDTAVAARKAADAGGSTRTARCRTGGLAYPPSRRRFPSVRRSPQGPRAGRSPRKGGAGRSVSERVRPGPEPGRYRAEATPPAADASLRGTGKPEADRGPSPGLRAGRHGPQPPRRQRPGNGVWMS